MTRGQCRAPLKNVTFPIFPGAKGLSKKVKKKENFADLSLFCQIGQLCIRIGIKMPFLAKLGVLLNPLAPRTATNALNDPLGHLGPVGQV